MKISVLIPTWRRPGALARCLDGLEQQARRPDELVLIVRAEDEATHSLLADRQRLPFPVRVVAPDGSGVIAALNKGFDSVAGDIIALTDDDTAAAADWLNRIEAHFREDSELGGLGGRDRIVSNGRSAQGSGQPLVGRVRWFGSVVGNHHLGAGEAREVDILKGANMALRRNAIADKRLDPVMRGNGTEHHWEIDLSLSLKAAGWKLVYDPAVLVDHYEEPRVTDQRDALKSAGERYDAIHNQTYALLKHLPPGRRLVAYAYGLLIGTRANPGPLLALELLVMRRLPLREVGNRLEVATRARLSAIRSWWTWRHSAR